MADDKYPPAPVTYTDQSGQHFSRVDEMSDAPEMVWVTFMDDVYEDGEDGPFPLDALLPDDAKPERGDLEYVRADIHRREMVAFDQLEAEVARLREVLEPTVRRLEQVLAGQPVRDADEVILAARRALNRETTDE